MPEEFCTFDTCPDPVWVAGMVYVSAFDVESVHNERESKGLRPIECERCGRKYHLTLSADAYA